ncbi:MAG: YqgE/AlgH family protein [Kineosporiaceae bacterium]
MSGLAGRLLVAAPTLEDPSFRRSVVLVLDHGDTGALGVVVNRPLDVDVDAVLPVWQPHVTAPGRLFQGGPVQLDSALGLVAVPGDGEEPAGVKRILGSIGLVDLDTPPELIRGGVAGVRIFAGYAGWSPGQLEGEVAEGSWFVVDCEPRDPFSATPSRLWSEVLRRQRGRLALLSTYPDDPARN